MKDLKADLEHQKYINEDMEDEINKKDDVIQSLQYGIDGKMKNIDDLVQIRNENEEKTNMLEKKVSVQHNLIEELKVNLKEKDETNTKENEDLDELKKEIKLLELANKEKEVALEKVASDNVMLKEKLESMNMHFKCKACDYRFESHEVLSSHMRKDQTFEEIESLMSEIKQLESENKQKENHLKEVHDENAMMHDKPKFLEENKIELIANLEKLKLQNAHSISLSEELNPAKVFTCERCDQTFGKCRDLRSRIRNKHKEREVTTTMKLRLHKLEKQILQQKLDITTKIADLKETESLEEQTCRCRGWCAITHQKHSWKPIRSKRILKMIQSSGINFQP